MPRTPGKGTPVFGHLQPSQATNSYQVIFIQGDLNSRTVFDDNGAGSQAKDVLLEAGGLLGPQQGSYFLRTFHRIFVESQISAAPIAQHCYSDALAGSPRPPAHGSDRQRPALAAGAVARGAGLMLHVFFVVLLERIEQVQFSPQLPVWMLHDVAATA